MPEQRRAVVIGCGRRARAHVEAYGLLDEARVTACFAPSERRRERLARRHGLTAYDDLDRMLSEESPDIVHVVTWPDVRVPLMRQVARHGVRLCTVEKPLVSTVDDLLALERLSAETETRFGVSHQLGWHPDLAACIAAAQGGGIGAVRLVEMSTRLGALDQGTHLLSYGRQLLSGARIVEVMAQVSGWDDATPGHAAPAAATAYLRYDSGARGSWTTGPLAPQVKDKADGQCLRLVGWGSAGRAQYEEFGGWTVQTPDGTRQGEVGDIRAWREKNTAAQAGFFRAMFAWDADPASPPPTALQEALHEQRALFSIYLSALRGAPVTVGAALPADLVARVARRASEPERPA